MSHPAQGPETPFSIANIARTAALTLGESWSSVPGVFGVSGTVHAPDGRCYLVEVGDTSNMSRPSLCVWHDDDQRVLDAASEEDGLVHLADTVAVTIRLMHYADSPAPWNAGHHLRAVLAAHGRTARTEAHRDGAYIVLAGHDGQFVTISGSTWPGDENCHDYAPTDHDGWTAVLRDADGTQTRVIYQSPEGLNHDFAEDTALLAAVVLPLTPAQAP
ncbi:hypothetical protein [Streptomyces subrutilus]|uniref:Uncharacterized protein n=1 Tax=Streptomyces subrutilus TaxID=36818 RepID=A0A1E5NXQ4_9ACTN|nr:hypothetical protein [Streptomyces subrutilus]OEJ21046.1 hypothetical protein BGK67_34690 [Streptomyces subrutilus]